MSTQTARQVLVDAIARRVFPGAAAEMGSGARVLWRDALGTLQFDPAAPHTAPDTLFDLSSLTKVVATTTVVMQLVDDGRVELREPIASVFDEWRGADRASVTVRDLLEHSSGLAARLVDRPPPGRREFEHDICTMPLEYVPRSASVYSDLGFLLLGFLAADAGREPLQVQFAAIWQRLQETDRTLATESLTFRPALELKRQAAPTLPMDDDPRRGRLLVGEVHDDYAAALDGVAGHAGLFGTVGAIGGFARAILRARNGDQKLPSLLRPSLVQRFVAKSQVPGSSRALGWDTMLPTSSCGTRMGPAAFGHVGFTGTSLWIDPERDRYVVLLTNRACGGGTPDEMLKVRAALHDALGE